MKALQIIGIIFLVIIAICVVLAMEAGVIMLLWNYVLCWLFPAIPMLTFWRAVGVSCIISILSGMFGGTITIKNKY